MTTSTTQAPTSAPPSAAPATTGAAPSTPAVQLRKLAGQGLAAQLRALAPQDGGADDAERVRATAAEGVASGGGRLPYHEKIQAAFGRHDVSNVRAHSGPEAATANRLLGAKGYATGTDVAFAGAPDLHTAAHEATHVVQQRQGVSLKGGVGATGDAYERQADAVADRVVQGKSAEDLLGAPRPGGGASQAVQKKAYIGPNFRPPAETKDEKVNNLVKDDKVRRFADDAELKAFAGGTSDSCGYLDAEKTWVRFDGPMVVLGENHGASKVPDMLKATRLSRYRYEGFTHHSATRKSASPPLSEHLAQTEKKYLDKVAGGGVAQGAEPDHSAEHALPKYTRVIPDAKALANKQLGVDQKDALQVDEIKADTDADAPLGDEYSLQKALITSLLSAFLYAKSYGGKFFGHELKAFYAADKNGVDLWIKTLEDDIAAKRVPDFSMLDLALLDRMHTAYSAAAKKKVGLDKPGALEEFKKKLDTEGETKVAITKQSKEDDYLRDKSMLDTMKGAKAAGDKLFVVGDAHRKKLQPLIEGLGCEAMTDASFLARHKKLDADAGVGVTPTDRSKLEQVKESVKVAFPSPKPTRVGAKFKLPIQGFTDCQWTLKRGVEATGTPGEFKLTGEIGELELVWAKGGLSESLRTIKIDVRTKATVAPKKGDKPKATTLDEKHSQPPSDEKTEVVSPTSG